MATFFSRAAFRGASPFQIPKRTVFNTQKLWSRENLPFYGFTVGMAALSFQVGVLYPWHEEVNNQVKGLVKATDKIDVLSVNLETRIRDITTLQEKVKDKERKILQLEDQILKRIVEIKSSCAEAAAAKAQQQAVVAESATPVVAVVDVPLSAPAVAVDAAEVSADKKA